MARWLAHYLALTWPRIPYGPNWGHARGHIKWASSRPARAKQSPVEGTSAHKILTCSLGQSACGHHAEMSVKTAWDDDTVLS